MIKVLIKNGTVVDPSQGIVDKIDLLIEGDRIKRLDYEIFEPEAQVIDASGLIVAPGFVDLHVHFRDPGQTYKEDILSGSKCAVAGGFTTVVAMPNTNPPIDSPHVARYVSAQGKCWGLCDVLPAGTITVGRKGEELSDFYALKEAGCVCFTDDGSPVQRTDIMQKALIFSSELGVPIMNHCEDDLLSQGSVTEGYLSALTGLKSRYPEAEETMIARDCVLAYRTGGHLHVQHLTTGFGVELIRFFKEKGVKVTCEVNPYHLLLDEGTMLSEGPLARVNPPLRKKEDVLALREALREGVIDCVATDHAPHAPYEKGLIDSSLPGMIGLQTALPIMLKLVEEEVISLVRMVDLMSCAPAKIIGLEVGTLKEGSPADVVIFDPKKEWVLNEETNFSKSKNTPLWGKPLKGKVIYTLKGGRIVYKENS